MSRDARANAATVLAAAVVLVIGLAAVAIERGCDATGLHVEAPGGGVSSAPPTLQVVEEPSR